VRILFTTSIFPPDIGGPAQYVPQMAAEMIQRGHSVTVICLSEAIAVDDRAYPFPVVRIQRRLLSPLRLLLATFTIYQQARNADLIYQNGLPVESAVAARLARIPVVAKVVSDYAWERARNRGWFSGNAADYQTAIKGIRLRLLDWFRTLPLQHARCIIVPSVWLKQMIVGWGIAPERVEVVYNAVEPIEPVPQTLPPFAGKTIVTLCRLVPWKGVDELIRVLPNLPDVRLVVIGDGAMRPQLEVLATNLAVNDRVLFTGQLPKEQALGYLQQANLFVLNSSYEGLPHVVLEAMAVGVPVVATDAGGTGEVVVDGKTGLLVPIADARSLQAAIQRILSDPNLANQLVTTAKQQLASQFVYAKMVDTTEKILLNQGWQ
jgi:glycosyltransferase involved in cell wall biosynthesis